MLPKAYVGHSIETRTRFYLPQERNRIDLFSKIENEFVNCEGVEYVKTNPLTGSVLVLHTEKLPKLTAYAQETGLFEVDPSLTEHKTWAEDVKERINHADKKIDDATDGELNLSTLVALGLLGAGTYQFSRKRFFPAASSLITDAMRILLQANRKSARSLKVEL